MAKGKATRNATGPTLGDGQPPALGAPPPRPKLKGKVYLAELAKLEVELSKLQEWIRARGLKVVIVFEGRDAAGKGGSIKTITAGPQPARGPDRRPSRPVGPRAVAVVLPALRRSTCPPPARWSSSTAAGTTAPASSGSWASRPPRRSRSSTAPARSSSGCSSRSGIILIKYWFSVSDAEQERRFQARIADPTKRWKLSPMDLQSRTRWVEYSRAKDEMFRHTDIKQAPWYVVNGDDKRRARLNVISHLLSLIPYEDLTPGADRPAAARARPRLRPPADRRADVRARASTEPPGGGRSGRRPRRARTTARARGRGGASRTRRMLSAYDGQMARLGASVAGTHRSPSCSHDSRATASGLTRAAKIADTTTESAPSS